MVPDLDLPSKIRRGGIHKSQEETGDLDLIFIGNSPSKSGTLDCKGCK